MADGSSKILTITEPEHVDAGVTSVAISPDGRLVAAGSLDNVVRIWDAQTGNLIERLKGHKDSVYSVAFTPDGKGLVSGSLDNTLKHWDITPMLRRKDRKEGGEKGCVCTLNFNGHKVRTVVDTLESSIYQATSSCNLGLRIVCCRFS